MERSAEFLPNEPVKTESGYSEKETAKIIEGNLMDTKNPKKRNPVQAIPRKDKIVAAYRKNTEKILQIIQSLYQLDGKNHRQEEQLVEDILGLRHMQEELLNALLLEQKASLTEESISKDAWNLIQ